MNARLTFIQALTSLHPGTGQGTGVIDLPVAREVATGIPYLPGSSLKGVLRDRCGESEACSQIFGPKVGNISESNNHAGAAIFSDQRVLLLAVRSLAGTTAWVTSPFVLQRLRRDCLNMGLAPEPPQVGIPAGSPLERARVIKGSALKIKLNRGKGVVMLEDLDLQAKEGLRVTREWSDWLKERLFPGDAAWQERFALRFCIVHDDVFSFLLDTATEVTARNKLKEETKTSDNLWYQEALPAETILQGIVVGQQVGKDGLAPDEVLDKVAGLVNGPVQLGGSSSVGRGLCRVMVGG